VDNLGWAKLTNTVTAEAPPATDGKIRRMLADHSGDVTRSGKARRLAPLSGWQD
jgi:hypothetical protein